MNGKNGKIPLPILRVMTRGGRNILPKDVRILKVLHTSSGVQIEGDNPTQNFIEIWSEGGEFLGMLLQVKGEEFWQVWDKNRHVMTKPLSPGRSQTVGSTHRATAMRMLHKKVLNYVVEGKETR